MNARNDDRHSSASHSHSYNTSPSGFVGSDKNRPGFNLLVAGCRGGKTSFIRLLLDTSHTAQNTSQDQLSSLAKFVQGCSAHTPYIRTVSVEVEGENNSGQPLNLTLVDTPSIDTTDESAERVLNEIVRHVDTRFVEAMEDDRVAHHGGRFIHLCIYFLDPDQIIPPAIPAPVPPRPRNGSLSQSEQEPVMLEPPVTTNPLLSRPTLPAADILTIRRLSSRVNVLPVIAKSDVLSNERLAAIRMAVRTDLANAGIGFGIFDENYGHHQEDELAPRQSLNGYSEHHNGSASSKGNSPPASPAAPSLLKLPYALISPDLYCHSDGVPRKHPSRQDLVHQYTPSYLRPPPSKIVRGKYLRNYRWGSLDVLDPIHSDFLPLRNAVFHHMETLQDYTRDYLFKNYKTEFQLQHGPARLSLPHHQPLPSHGMSHLGLSHSARPVLAIDTAASHAGLSRHPSLQMPRDSGNGVDYRSAQLPSRPMAESISSMSSKSNNGVSSVAESARQRSKKITVACNFCRSRKLKCDGGRPACGQCVKRTNPCDYQAHNKRRGTFRHSRGGESDSESEEPSPDPEPSFSPESVTHGLPPRRHSNVEALLSVDDCPPGSRSAILPGEKRTLFLGNELPHIATLSLPDHSPSTPVPMSAPSLPPIRPTSEVQAAQRKRAATVPGKSTRLATTSGPKVVACNFCRARKTKCDGVHPACSSCARRSLPCNYIHDGTNGGGGRKPRRSSAAKAPPESPTSPSSSRMVPTPSSAKYEGYDQRDDIKIEGEFDLKRTPMDYPDSRPGKRMRLDLSPPLLGNLA